MGFTNPFKSEPSLSDLEEKEQFLDQKRKVKEEELAIKQLNDKLGEGKWKLFSSNGKKSGFSLSKALAWLKSH